MTKTRILYFGVDSGVVAVGFAAIYVSRTGDVYPLDACVLRPGKPPTIHREDCSTHILFSPDFAFQACALAHYVRERIRFVSNMHRLTDEDDWEGVLLIEGQEHWSGSQKSQKATARGDIMKVSVATGAIINAVATMGGPRGEAHVQRVEVIPPSEWKGTLSKEQVIARIERRAPGLPRAFITSHAADATGIILSHIGRF